MMQEKKLVRVCIVDDEPIACRKIQGLLKDDPEIEIIRVCSNGEEASEVIRKQFPDLVFLDVQMPSMDGFEVLDSLQDMESMPYVIFVTAYDRYAIRAFEVHALDYLLKPFDKKRFVDALKRAKVQIVQNATKSHTHGVRGLLEDTKLHPRNVDRLVINNRVVRVDEIDWIEAQGKYSSVHTRQDSYLVREGMSSFEAELNSNKFVRIHKSTIVNIDRIEHIQPMFHGDYRIILRDGTVLTVSRRYRQKLDEIFGKHL